MAGSPEEEWYLHIQPTTLTDLTVTYNVGSAGSSVTSYTKTLSNFSISNGYLVCKLSTDYYPQNTVISSTGYVTAEQTNNWFGFGNDDHYETLKPEHLYKWTNSEQNISYYTSTPTPTTNAFIYNATGDNVTNTYIHGGDTQAWFSSSNNTTMVYNIVWGSPAANYSAVLPIGGTYTAAGGINPKEK